MNTNQLAHRAPIIKSNTFQTYRKVGAWRNMDVYVYESVNLRFHPIAKNGKILIKLEFNTFDKYRKELVFFDQYNEIELQDSHTDFRQVVKENSALLYHELLQQIKKDVRASANLYLPNWDKLRISNVQEDGLLTKPVEANAVTD